MQRLKVLILYFSVFFSTWTYASSDTSCLYNVFSGKKIVFSSEDGIKRFCENPYACEIFTLWRELLQSMSGGSGGILENVFLAIDVQFEFEASRSQFLQDNIIKQILRARKRGDLIIFLEYKGDGPTIPRIMEAVEGYEHFYVGTKTSDCGAKLVGDLIEELGISLVKNIRVCGVRTESCVFNTIYGLSLSPMFLKIFILGNACNSGHGLRELPNGQDMNNKKWVDKIKSVIFNVEAIWD